MENAAAPGRPKQGTAPSGGSAVHEVTSVGAMCPPIGQVVDERCIVNAMVALLATGGSTNHLIHWVAVARAAGIVIDWTDFADLSAAVPLLARVYPNGSADVNQFQAAGGPGFVLRELLDAGYLHAGVAIGVDPRQQRHDGRQIGKIGPVDGDAGRPRHRHPVDQVVG